MNKYEEIQYIRTFSDLHLDFDVKKKFNMDDLWFPEPLDTDSQTLLVLPGDLWHAKKPLQYCNQSWLKIICERFKYVIVLLGNHDLWNGNIPYTYNAFRTLAADQNLKNLILLENSIAYFGDLKVVGSTLWTDFNKYDNDLIREASKMMNDYKYIKYGNSFRKIKGSDIANEHIKAKDFIFKNAVKEYEGQKLLVLSHHAPSFKSIYVAELFNIVFDKKDDDYYYASDLDDLIRNSVINMWIHGHTHQVVDYYIGNTRVISNPRGYENSGEITLYNKVSLYLVEEL